MLSSICWDTDTSCYIQWLNINQTFIFIYTWSITSVGNHWPFRHFEDCQANIIDSCACGTRPTFLRVHNAEQEMLFLPGDLFSPPLFWRIPLICMFLYCCLDFSIYIYFLGTSWILLTYRHNWGQTFVLCEYKFVKEKIGNKFIKGYINYTESKDIDTVTCGRCGRICIRARKHFTVVRQFTTFIYPMLLF